MSRFNSTQANNSDSSPRYAPSFNTGGGALELEIRDAEERRISLLVTAACERCAAGMATENAQDIAQEAAIELMERIRSGLVLSGDEHIRAYAIVATRRSRLMITRAEQRRAAHEACVEEPPEDETPLWHQAEHRAEVYAVRRAYKNVAQHMPKEWRRAFELIQLEDRSCAEVSEMMGVSETALRKRVSKAQEYLKAHFVTLLAEHQSGVAT